MQNVLIPAAVSALPASGKANSPAVVDAFLERLRFLDASGLAAQFTQKGQVWMGGSAAPAIGREAVRKAFVRLLSRVLSFSWAEVYRWQRQGVTVIELDLRIVRDDYFVLDVPLTLVLWVEGRQIQSCRLSTYREGNWLIA